MHVARRRSAHLQVLFKVNVREGAIVRAQHEARHAVRTQYRRANVLSYCLAAHVRRRVADIHRRGPGCLRFARAVPCMRTAESIR